MRPFVDIKSRNFCITNKILGSGSFSLVKVAYNKGSKTPIALKICHCNSESEWLQSLNEVCLLKKLNHKNIAKLNNYEITRFHVLIGLDIGEGTLKQFIRERDPQELKHYGISIMSQIINALNYIHSFKIIHGDIKPSNIIYILEKNCLTIQIMDFGLSHVVPIEDGYITQSDAGGTKSYLAPERLYHLKYDETCDLFSAGIVFFEILFKQHPFYKEGDNYVETMKRKPNPKFPQGYQNHVPKEWLIILCNLLSYQPSHRNEVRNNSLLQTKFNIDLATDHQVEALEYISNAEKAEQNGNYLESAINFMQASIDLEIACHQIIREDKNFGKELKARMIECRKKVQFVLHLSKQSYSQFITMEDSNIHDEYYDYLMEVTASTPNLKHYLELGYTGELYFREHKNDMAFKNIMDALQYLNLGMSLEPPGDRKSIIGKKMLQWTKIAETLRSNQ